MRMQFYAIEIARCVPLDWHGAEMADQVRNRKGLNDWIYEREHPNQILADS